MPSSRDNETQTASGEYWSKILGVAQDATPEEIQLVYLSRKSYLEAKAPALMTSPEAEAHAAALERLELSLEESSGRWDS